MCTVSLAMLNFRPYPLPFATTFFPKSVLLKTPPVLSVFSTSAAATISTLQSLTSTLNSNPNLNLNLSYGPSIHKGRPQPQPQNPPHRRVLPFKPFADAKQPNPEEEEDEEVILEEEEGESYIFNESAFTRVFDIAAIRVPSGECFSLESRLRGHLLNWPRIRNIARVPGDEVEEELADLLEQPGSSAGDDESALVSLNRRIYGKAEEDGEYLCPVLYREKLVKSFNSRGFAKFENLAKMSSPKKKKKKKNRKEEESGGGGKMGIRKSAFAMVEVVEDGKQREDLSGLLGEEFKGRMRMWRGSTRLLLLDERYADRGVDELPEAIKVAVPNTLILCLVKRRHWAT